jgi:hypothetical protein
MDWQRIMADAGVPDSPGRDEAIRSMDEKRPYKASYRDKKTGLVTTERIMAVNFKDALTQVRQRGTTLLSIVEDW